jgi:predicted transglutaminase-like cysteine proteinase
MKFALIATLLMSTLLFFLTSSVAVASKDGGSSGVKYIKLKSFPNWNRVMSVAYQNNYRSSQNITLDMIRGINTDINKVRYISDIDNWGKEDYWETPAEFYARGGDCEDFAIAKYFRLLEDGLSPDNMELLVLAKKRNREYHAVLKVKFEGNVYILDSEYDRIQQESHLENFNVMYHLTHKGWLVNKS